MIRIGNVWITPSLITHVVDQPDEDRLVVGFVGSGWHTFVGDDRQRLLDVLRERQEGTLDDLREKHARAAAALLPRKEG